MVIINAKGIELLRRCYASVCRNSYPNFEVVVVDCLSEDIGFFETQALPRTEVVHLDTDVGPAEQHNVGARRASSDSKYLAFVDNDVELGERWLESLVAALEASSDQVASAAGCTRDTARGKFVDDLLLQYPGVQRVHFAEAPTRGTRLIDFQPGEAFVVRKDVFLALGGYDAGFFIYSDDSDFGWRLRLSGRDILLVADAQAIHHRSATAGGNPRFRSFRVRNGIVSAFKNLETGSLPMLALNEMFRLFGLVAGSLFDGEARTLLGSYLAGWASVGKIDVHSLMENRRTVQRARRRTDREIFARTRRESALVLETGDVDLPMLKAYFLISAILYRLLPSNRSRL